MRILPLMNQLSQNNINFDGCLTVNHYDYIPETGEIKKTTHQTLQLNADLSSFLNRYITNNILRVYGRGDHSMRDYVYEGLLEAIENNKEKQAKGIELPHAYRPNYLDYSVPIDRLGLAEYSNFMVKYSAWRDKDNLYLKIGNKLTIQV